METIEDPEAERRPAMVSIEEAHAVLLHYMGKYKQILEVGTAVQRQRNIVALSQRVTWWANLVQDMEDHDVAF